MLVLVVLAVVVVVLLLGVVYLQAQRARDAGEALRQRTEVGQDAASVESEARRLLLEAETRQKESLLEAKEEAMRLRAQADAEIRERTSELQRQERRIAQKEETLDRKADAYEKRERQIAQREQEADDARAKLEQLRAERVQEIERIAGLTAQEARDLLIAEVEREVRDDANRRLHQIEAEYEETARRRAREIVSTALQRVTSDVTAETTVTVVPIPSEEMKGRIIGREGRNIRTLEQLTGCDLIIDDTPDAVTLSGFDPVRREVARIALAHLVQDGRIHPTRIEEVVEKAKIEVEASLKSIGETGAVDAGVPSLHPELHKLLGRLRYRMAYGQNLLRHSQETAELGALLAAEIGAEPSVVRRAGLLHDIGKAVDHEIEGSHAQIGAEMAKRYGQPPAVAHAIEAHRGEVEPRSVEAILLQIADSLSASRVGARRESLDHYIKRQEELEQLCESFDGVDKAFAIQAGREVRVIVKPDDVDDLGAMRLARDVSKRIEESLEYPGQIKVTVIRERRTTEIAR